jgi:CNT family concentrative nucleoside transporter
MIERGFSFLGIAVLLGLAFLFSTSRRHVPWRLVIVGISLQAYLAIFIVRTDWVPVALTVSAVIAAGAIVAAMLGREIRGAGAARVLGLLGLGVFGLAFALTDTSGAAPWLAVPCGVGLLVSLLPFVSPAVGSIVAVAGCGTITYGVWTGVVPENFVFRGVQGMGDAVTWVIGFAHRAAEEVFGPILGLEGYIFAIEVGAIILLFGGLMAVLYHVGVIPWLVGLLARLLHRALGVSGAESLAAASNVFVGQTEAPLIIRPYLDRMTRSEIMALMTGGFATIAGSVLGLYILWLTQAGLERGAADLIAASVMSAPAAFVFAKLLVPETETPETRGGVEFTAEPIGTNLLDALAGGVSAGLRLAVNVVAMLLVFYALIYMLNDIVEWVAHTVFGAEKVTFAHLYGYPFSAFAFLLGVEWGDCRAVGELLGTKTIFNELFAYKDLGELVRSGGISTRSAVLATYALCGFANFMSIGIQIAGLSQIAPGRRPQFSALALRAMIGGALACQLTACIVGLIGQF